MTRAARHTIKVRVVKKKTGWEVDVDEKFNDNHVRKGTNPQLITWEILDSGSNNYRFVEMDHDPPGFSWMDTPKPTLGIFSPAQLCHDCGHLQMTDLHDGNSSLGDFIYRLRIWVGENEIAETAYSAGAREVDPCELPTDPCQLRFMVTTNPRIKNT